MQFMTASRAEAETAFIVAKNNEGAELIPGTVCEFTITATDADQGSLVEKVDIVVNATTGIAAPVAGVVESTIAIADYGRLQVYGPATVRASAALAAGRLAVATSAGVAPTGVVTADVQTTSTTAAYAKAGLGFCLENVNATQCRVQLQLL